MPTKRTPRDPSTPATQPIDLQYPLTLVHPKTSAERVVGNPTAYVNEVARGFVVKNNASASSPPASVSS